MRVTMKKTILALAIAGAVSASTPAIAWSDVTKSMPWIGQKFFEMVTSMFTDQFSNMLSGYSKAKDKALAVVGQGISATYNKSMTADVETRQAIASYDAQQRAQWRANDAAASLEQSPAICQTVLTANGLSALESRVATTASQQIARTSAQSAYTTSAAANTEQSYKYTMANFCTDDDVKLKRCTKAADENLKGADYRSDLLFGDGQGSKSRDPAQSAAANKIIERLSGGGNAPELLRTQQMEQTPQGREYVELQRRYAAYMSIVNTSLHNVSANHEPSNR